MLSRAFSGPDTHNRAGSTSRELLELFRSLSSLSFNRKKSAMHLERAGAATDLAPDLGLCSSLKLTVGHADAGRGPLATSRPADIARALSEFERRHPGRRVFVAFVAAAEHSALAQRVAAAAAGHAEDDGLSPRWCPLSREAELCLSGLAYGKEGLGIVEVAIPKDEWVT